MQKLIDEFTADKKVALAGVSRDTRKWGFRLYLSLKNKGYTVYPVNPSASEINGVPAYGSIAALPADVKNVIIAVPRELTAALLNDCVKAGIKRIWLNNGGEEVPGVKELIEDCTRKGISVIYGVCPMMSYPGAGIHKLHLWVKKLFGLMPGGYSE